jgi:hypothetical protein
MEVAKKEKPKKLTSLVGSGYTDEKESGGLPCVWDA